MVSANHASSNSAWMRCLECWLEYFYPLDKVIRSLNNWGLGTRLCRDILIAVLFVFPMMHVGVFALKSRHCIFGDHFPYSHDLNV